MVSDPEEYEEGLIIGSTDEGLATYSNPDISVDMVQQIVSNERQRSRRALWGVTLFFLLLTLLVIVVVLTIGLHTMKDASLAQVAVNDVRKQQSELESTASSLSSRLADLRRESVRLDTNLEAEKEKKVSEQRELFADLERFGAYQEANDAYTSRQLEKLLKRVQELEKNQLGARDVLDQVRASDGPAPVAGADEGGDDVVDDNRIPLAARSEPEGDPEPEYLEPLDQPENALEPVYEPEIALTATPEFPLLPPPDGENDEPRNGPGTYVYENGDRYQGLFKSNERHGKGTMMFANGERYSGTFKDDRMHGEGVYQFVNGDRYEGTFVEGVREGYGTYIYKDAGRYVGSFMNGERHGKGTYVYRSGARYEGEFSQGVMQGVGVYVFPDGTRMEGVWRNGAIVSGGSGAP